MSDVVTLRFPGTAHYVRLARLVAAEAAHRAGFDMEDIEDLRIAVSELCGIVGGDTTVETTLEFVVSGGRVEVTGSGAAATPDEDTEFAEALVSAVTEEYSIDRGDDATAFRFVKQSVAGD